MFRMHCFGMQELQGGLKLFSVIKDCSVKINRRHGSHTSRQQRNSYFCVLCWEAVIAWDACQVLQEHPVAIYLAGQTEGTCSAVASLKDFWNDEYSLKESVKVK